MDAPYYFSQHFLAAFQILCNFIVVDEKMTKQGTKYGI